MPSEPFRTTISISGDVGDRAQSAANADKRNFSNFCEVALVAYMDGKPDPTQTQEVLAAVEQIGPERALAALRAAARKYGRRVPV